MQNNNQAKTEKTKKTEAFLCPFCGAPYKELIPAGVAVKVTVTMGGFVLLLLSLVAFLKNRNQSV